MTLNIQDRRKHQRHEFNDVVTIGAKGISQVIDISSGGISFRCRNEQNIPKKWLIDIVDSTGIHLEEFPVERIWKSAEDKKKHTCKYITTVGLKFKRLSLEQRVALYELIYR
ncbi:MAG: hypothetical protein BA862_06125 [Desulfobulbaceae bacterium S3730MH12]|nr:MAG: hypothetical protein BA862_06125 [Desulfobulbaceae bacterium S3730MH12]OEU81602.1 MAG: hypothetical protein BA873_07420 [Desulfobulbaceae bacterium C00003063]